MSEDYEIVTVRASDIDAHKDTIELPEYVWMWDEKARKFQGRFLLNAGLKYPGWHVVYDMFGTAALDHDYIRDVGAEDAWRDLNDRFVLVRIGTERPDSGDYPDTLIALHEYELVRVQRTLAPATPVTEQEGT